MDGSSSNYHLIDVASDAAAETCIEWRGPRTRSRGFHIHHHLNSLYELISMMGEDFPSTTMFETLIYRSSIFNREATNC